MITVRQIVYSTTIIGIFSSAFMYEIGTFRIIYFYFVMLLNLLLMAYAGRIWFPKGLVGLIGFIGISGLIGVANGTDTFPLFLKELVAILFSAVYFCSFVRMIDFDVARCFRTYAKTAYYVCIFGFLLFPFQRLLNLRDPERLRSVLSEPAAFATVCLPAFYYYIDRWQRGLGASKQVLVFVTAFALARSSTGFIGILFGVYLFCRRYRYGKLLIPMLILVIGSGLYLVSSDFRLRMDDSVGYLVGSDIGESNLSTYVLASNLFVTQQILSEHPLTGGGIGSHFVSHERFVDDIVGFDNWKNAGFSDLNAYDANSLLLRALSETGLIGVGLLFWSLWRYRPRGSGEALAIGQALSIYLFVALLRIGTYVNLEEVFFVVLYFVNSLDLVRSYSQSKLHVHAVSRLHVQSTDAV